LQKLFEYDKRLDKNESNIRDEFWKNRAETNKSAKESRDELSQALKLVEERLSNTITNFTGLIDRRIKYISDSLDTSSKSSREELNASLKSFEEKSSVKIEALSNETKAGLEKNRETVEKKLADIQKENSEKLEQMRRTVDEKLHDTLEKRLNESFQLVNSQLESVQKGLGEMQALATGVGDLKKVLTNVSQRGNLGESQLGAILEQILSNDQFEKNVPTKENSSERVDYVIKLPNKNDKNEALLLPVDSKFPIEDYQRLLDSYENATNLSKEEMHSISKQFEITIMREAKKIQEKYINPPQTTDFALMFVPTEGLFAEIVKRPALCEKLRRDYKITVVGPTNFAALLNSLQMGFQTLAIEKRSSEVWKTLGAVKTGFRNFGEALANTKKKLVAATNEIDNVETKSRTLERKLRDVEGLPMSDSKVLIGDIDVSQDYDEE
jgi:DNA recombination protein RmuC